MKAIIVAVALGIVLTGCNGSTTTPATPAPPTNISGDYSGTMQDTKAGSATATATFAQQGSNAGGAIAAVFVNPTGALNIQTTLSINASNSTAGTMVIDYPNNGPTCTFSTTGTYNTTTNVLSGSYTAVTNCTGDSGTYSLTQQCTDTVTSGDRQRMNTGGVAPC